MGCFAKICHGVTLLKSFSSAQDKNFMNPRLLPGLRGFAVSAPHSSKTTTQLFSRNFLYNIKVYGRIRACISHPRHTFLATRCDAPSPRRLSPVQERRAPPHLPAGVRPASEPRTTKKPPTLPPVVGAERLPWSADTFDCDCCFFV